MKVLVGDGYCRPSCEDHDHDDPEDEEAEDCGCPAHEQEAVKTPKEGDFVRLHVWNGRGYTVVEGHVAAVDPNPDEPENPLLILHEDDANTYAASQVAHVEEVGT